MTKIILILISLFSSFFLSNYLDKTMGEVGFNRIIIKSLNREFDKDDLKKLRREYDGPILALKEISLSDNYYVTIFNGDISSLYNLEISGITINSEFAEDEFNSFDVIGNNITIEGNNYIIDSRTPGYKLRCKEVFIPSSRYKKKLTFNELQFFNLSGNRSDVKKLLSIIGYSPQSYILVDFNDKQVNIEILNSIFFSLLLSILSIRFIVFFKKINKHFYNRFKKHYKVHYLFPSLKRSLKDIIIWSVIFLITVTVLYFSGKRILSSIFQILYKMKNIILLSDLKLYLLTSYIPSYPELLYFVIFHLLCIFLIIYILLIFIYIIREKNIDKNLLLCFFLTIIPLFLFFRVMPIKELFLLWILISSRNIYYRPKEKI